MGSTFLSENASFKLVDAHEKILELKARVTELEQLLREVAEFHKPICKGWDLDAECDDEFDMCERELATRVWGALGVRPEKKDV